MTDQELIQKLQTLRNIKPSQEWLSRSEKSLKAVMPKSQWPVYSVIFVLALGLSLLGAIHELPVQESPEKPIKIVQEQQQAQIKQILTKTSKNAEKIAQRLIKSIEEQKVSASIAEPKSDDATVDAKVKLEEDLDQLEKIQELRGVLQAIEQDIEQGDYVIARQKLDKYLDSLKVDSEKSNDNN